jgi:hypothetical protein
LQEEEAVESTSVSNQSDQPNTSQSNISLKLDTVEEDKNEKYRETSGESASGNDSDHNTSWRTAIIEDETPNASLEKVVGGNKQKPKEYHLFRNDVQHTTKHD